MTPRYPRKQIRDLRVRVAELEAIAALLTHRAENGFIQHKFNGHAVGFHPVGMEGCAICAVTTQQEEAPTNG